MPRIGAAPFVLLLLAATPPAAAQGSDDWAEHWRGDPYPGSCEGAHCFGGPNETAAGEWLMFVGTGFARGTAVTMRILAPDGTPRVERVVGPEGDELWDGSWGPRIDFLVPAGAEKGNWSARIEWQGRNISHPFRVVPAPRIFPLEAVPPPQGSSTNLRIVGFDEGPFELTVVQNGTRWNASYQLARSEPAWVTLASQGMHVPGAKLPELAMNARGTLSMLEGGFVVIAREGALVSVWANGTREGERVSASLSFTVPPGGQRAWVKVLPPTVIVSPGGSVSYSPSPEGGCGRTVDATAHVFGTGVRGQVPVRIYGPDGSLVAGSDALAADYVEETIPLRGAAPGRYVASVGDDRVEFSVSDGCQPTTPMRHPPPARRFGIPAPGLEVALLVIGLALVARRRSG